jgi:hypothetical protein
LRKQLQTKKHNSGIDIADVIFMDEADLALVDKLKKKIFN